MVEQLEDIKGYSNLNPVDKIKFALGLKNYLDKIKPDDLECMDILEIRKSKFKVPVYYTTFLFGDLEEIITIKFSKNMLLKK